MWKKKSIWIIVLLLSISVAYSALCTDKLVTGKSCTYPTPYLSCGNYTYTIYNMSGTSILINQSLTLVNGSIYSLVFNQTALGGYTILLCDSSTTFIDVIMEGRETMYLTIAFILAIFMALFLVLAIMLENVNFKLVSLIITMAFGWLLYAVGMKTSQQLGVNSISSLMVSGYKVVTYTFIAIIFLMVIYMFYNFLMALINRRKQKEIEESGEEQ